MPSHRRPRHGGPSGDERPGRASRGTAEHRVRYRHARAHVRPRPANALRLHTLLVTPWLAAGAGIVAAAALAVDVPHAVLSYGPSEQQPCHTSGCGAVRPRVLASGKPGSIQMEHPRTTRSSPTTEKRAPSRPAATGAVLDYQILQRTQHAFVAQVTLPRQAEHGDWKLSLSFPGAQVYQVIGARWHPNANGSAGTLSDDGSHRSKQQGRHARGGVTITIFATGNPDTPTGCTFNGATCSFR
jgi:hypothetical protein